MSAALAARPATAVDLPALLMMIECMQLGWLLAKRRPRAFVSQKLFFFGLPLGLATCRERSRVYAAE